MRVHELAKEIGLTSKEALEKLAGLGIEVKSHASSLTDDQASQLRATAVKGAPAPKSAPQRKTAPKAQAPEPKPEPAAKVPEPKPKPEPAAKAPRPVAAASEPEPAAKAPEPKPEPAAKAPEPDLKVSVAAIQVTRGITVEEFAHKLERSPSEVIKILLSLGEMKTITQSLSDDAVELVAGELGIEVEVVSPVSDGVDQTVVLDEEVENPANLVVRPPIVTVMGHVDHGKSSILQQFRKKEMLALEAGGITQAIGAYRVHDAAGRLVTFIDTPGHEAFTQMRARGAQVTDIAILVVAADDGVQPQTVEALDHARAASVPILVAVNKIDKPEADPTRVRQQLAELGLQPEEWGGDTVYVDISAKQGTNLDDLLEMIHLVAEMQEFKADPAASVRGVVIEAHLDKGRGPVATLIVLRGTLRVGDLVVCGTSWCRVRALTDEIGKTMPSAGPSQPVLVTGWSKVPAAGDEFRFVADERDAKRISQEREAKMRQADLVAGGKSRTLEDLLSLTRAGELPELRLIVKADTQGAIEALAESIAKTDQSAVRTTLLRRAVGAINENDITLAQASGAIVVGFNVRPDQGARQLAEKEGVDVRLYEVIYQLLDDIDKATKGLLVPEEEEVVMGGAQVRDLFRTPKGVVAGCYITEGKITRNSKARLLRDGTIVYTGEIASLRRFKEDVREVATGYECGIMISGYNDIKTGDVIETFEIREVARV